MGKILSVEEQLLALQRIEENQKIINKCKAEINLRRKENRSITNKLKYADEKLKRRKNNDRSQKTNSTKSAK